MAPLFVSSSEESSDDLLDEPSDELSESSESDELSESSDNDESTFSITLALDSIVVLISEVVTFVEDSSSLDDSPSDSEKTVVLSSFFSASDSFSDFTGTIFSSLSRSVPDSEEDEEDESDELDESDQPS